MTDSELLENIKLNLFLHGSNITRAIPSLSLGSSPTSSVDFLLMLSTESIRKSDLVNRAGKLLYRSNSPLITPSITVSIGHGDDITVSIGHGDEIYLTDPEIEEKNGTWACTLLEKKIVLRDNYLKTKETIITSEQRN